MTSSPTRPRWRAVHAATAGICMLALMALPRIVAAQTCQTGNPPSTCTTTSLANPATITNPRTIRLIMSTTTTSGTTLIADVDNAFAPLTGPSAAVNANRPWTLLISATTATWANAGVGSRVGKPVADLTWSTTGVNGSFVAMTTTPAQFATGGATNLTTTPLFYRVTLGWTVDTPGVYTINVTITATTP